MPLSNSGTCGGSTSDISFKYDIRWNDEETQVYNFLIGTDFGRGYAIWLDNVLWTSTDNFWWGENWDLAISITETLAAGNHELTIIGQEDCCDGSQ